MPTLRLMCLSLSACCLLAGCTDDPERRTGDADRVQEVSSLSLATKADSIASRIAEASGGLDAWNALPVLRFDFGVERDGQQQVAARHYWDKLQNRYRVEWPGGGDSTYVALFSAWPDSGRAFVNGTALNGEAGAAAMETARGRTINDTYWLLAPLKLFDEGVTRTYVPDSSDATTDVIRLSFENVGLTPGDQYWLFADRESGQLQRWTFVLEGNPQPRSFEWTAYTQLSGPGGPVLLSARKQRDVVAILTDQLRAPNAPDSTLFSDPQPRL